MKLTFVGHASIHLTLPDGKGLLLDPWYESKVFNNGWALVSPSHIIEENRIDYLWISHEQPDHFNIPTLK